MSTPPQIALTIAGFDPSSGAGVTADLFVFNAFGLFGTSCITALTVQSTTGLRQVQPVAPDLLGATLDELESDLAAAGVKIGMLGGAAAVRAVAAWLQRTPKRTVVLDPVLVSSSGAPLLDGEGVRALIAELLPLVDWVTPNRAELAVLSGLSDVEQGMRGLAQRFPHLHIVATGGDDDPPTDRLLTPGGELQSFSGEHVATTSTHGTGCAFSSALLCRLLARDGPEEAVRAAKAYVTEALRQAPGVGKGKGPLGLLWPLRDKA
jgi:hydroxymethylpyrimidine/phosphomethylpyrimidine kinase